MLDADIKTYKSAEVSSATTNGGRISDDLVTSGVANNVWPHVPKSERVSGSTLYRKLFTVGASTDVEAMIAAMVRMFRPTAADDYVVAFNNSVTKTNTQASWSPSRVYGSAWLQANITAGAFTFVVTVEHADLTSMFQDGDTIILTDKATPDAVSGNEETLTISGTPTVSTLDVTITVSTAIVNSYTVAGEGFAAAQIPIGDVECSSENETVTTAGDGDYNFTGYPLILDNIGTVEDAITIEFTDATHFTCIGSSGIDYGTGDTATDFTPMNSDKSRKYFTLESGGFSGTWAGSDTITIDVHDCSFPYVLKRVVPAACDSLAGNLATSVVDAESEV